MLIHEKLGSKVFKSHVRFLENREAVTPNLIMADLGMVFVHYYFRMCGYRPEVEESKEKNKDGILVTTVSDYEFREIDERAFKKYNGLIKYKYPDLVLEENPDFGKVLTEFVIPFLPDNMKINVDNNVMTVKTFFDWDTVEFLRRKDKRCGRELSI